MNRKLATIVVGFLILVNLSFAGAAGSRTLAAGQMTEWYAYLAMVGNHYFSASSGKLNGYPTMALDTASIPHNQVKDTYTIPGGRNGYFPFIWADDESESFAVYVYKYLPDNQTTATTMRLTLPDSACFFAPVEFSSLLIERPSGDTASGSIINIAYMMIPPTF